MIKWGDIEEGKAGESEFTFLDFTEDDVAQLSMIPLMGGQMSRKDKIKEGIFIAKEEHNDMADKVMAMLYTLVDKFLDGAELDEITEAMTMTRLGQMIEKDGREKERIALNTLNKKLLSSNRIEDCIKATEDEEYQKKTHERIWYKINKTWPGHHLPDRSRP